MLVRLCRRCAPLAEVRAKKEEINSQLESNIQQQQAIEAELRKRDERRKSLPQLLVDTRTRLQKLEIGTSASARFCVSILACNKRVRTCVARA